MSHGVCDYDQCPKDTARTIRIAVNSNWDHLSARKGGYRVGHLSEMTVRVLAKDTSPPPTSTPAPPPPPTPRPRWRAGLVRPLRLRRRRPQDQHPGLPQLPGPDRAQHQPQHPRPRPRQPQRPRPRQPRPLYQHLRLLQRQPRPQSQHRCLPQLRPQHQPRCLLRLRCPLKRPRLPPHPPRYPRQPPRRRRRPRLHRGGSRRRSDSGTGPPGHCGACAATNATRLGGASDPNNRRCNTAHPQYLGRHCLHSTATHHADSDPGLRHRVCHRRVRVPDIA